MNKRSKALLVASIITGSLIYPGGYGYAADLTVDQQAVYDAVVAKFGSQITELQGWTRDLYIKSNAMPTPGTGKGVALGKDSIAKSESAVAIGNGANASEEEYANVAIGSAAQALGGSTVAIGSGAQSMTGGAVAIGTNVTLTDENSNGSTNFIGIGHSIHSNGVRSILIGEDIGTTDTPNKHGYMVGIGYKVNPSYDSVAIGSFSSTQGSGVAIGAGAHALADNGVAIGFTSFAASQNSVALGHNSYAYTGNVAAKSYLSNEDFSADNGVVAIGNNFELTLGDTKFPINHRRITGVAGGADEYDAVNVKQLKALSTDVDTRIANKMNNINGSSVEYVSINPDRDADEIINKDNHGAEKPGAIAIGSGATTNGYESIALGNRATVAYDGTEGKISGGQIAIGFGATANRAESLAIGVEAKADKGIAIGNLAYSNSSTAVGIGVNSKANSQGSIAIGNWTVAEVSGVAIGEDAVAHSDQSTALGYNTGAYTDNSVATGSNAAVYSKGSIAIGSNAVVYADAKDPINEETFQDKNDKQKANYKPSPKNSNSKPENNLYYRIGTTSGNGIAIGSNATVKQDQGLAIGMNAISEVLNGVAIGSNSKATVNSQVVGYDPNRDVKKDLESPVWKSKLGAVSVGYGEYTTASGRKMAANTRQITNVAAGFKDTDAVNVAQLKSLNQKVDTNKLSYVSIKSKETGNKDNLGATGTDSVAIGPNAQSIGKNSVALGSNVKASIADAIVIGRDITDGKGIIVGVSSVATTDHSIAIGVEADASGSARNTAVGWKSKATGDYSVAYGQNSQALGESSVALGTSVTANGKAGIAIGNSAVSNSENKTESSIAIGDRAKAESNAGVAIGLRTTASGDRSTALGFFANSSGKFATALGANTEAIGDSSVAMGSSATAEAERSIAIGSNSVADRAAGTFGYSPEAGAFANEGELITYLGKVDEYNALTTQAIEKNKEMLEKKAAADANPGDSTLLKAAVQARKELFAIIDERNKLSAAYKSGLGAVSVGNEYATRQITHVAAGTEDTDAVNVAQLKALNNKVDANEISYVSINSTETGNKDNTGATGTDSVAIGPNASASANNTVALGSNVTAGINNAIVIGSNITDGKGVVIGVNSAATSEHSVAIGTHATAGDTNQSDVAIGNYAKARGYSVAIGDGANAFDINDPTSDASGLSVAIGSSAAATGQGGVAVGQGAKAAFQSNAMGSGAKATGRGTVSIGDTSEASAAAAVALGNRAKATDTFSMALGMEAEAIKSGSIAVGAQTKANGGWSLAVGRSTVANGELTTALGYKTTADGARSIAIGPWANTSEGSYGTAIGYNAKTKGTNTIALGGYTEAFSDKAMALGYYSEGNVENGVALGAYSVADREKGKLGYTVDGVTFNKPEDIASYLGKTAEYEAATKDFNEKVAAYNAKYAELEKDPNNEQLKAEVDTLEKAAYASQNARSAIISPYVSGLGAISVGTASDTRQITHVAAGTEDTDAVNVAQLKQVQKLANNHTAIRVNDVGPVAGADGAYGEYVNTNGLAVAVKDVEGQKIYDFKLSKDITVGTPGKDGKPGEPGTPGEAGSITIIGEKGKDGADGTPGKNATAEITVKEGTPGVDGKDGETITRIVYETGEKDGNGNPIVTEVATLNDGMKFAGDDNTKYVAKKLNEQLDIKGGAAADTLSDNNIGVVADVDPKTSEITGLRVKLAKNLALADGSVAFDEAAIDADGNKLVKGQNGNWYTDLTDAVYDENTKSYTKGNETLDPVKAPSVGTVKLSATGLDNGNQRITHVAAGTENTDAVNYGQLTALISETSDTIGGKHTAIKVNDVAPVAGADGAYGVYVDTNGLSVGVKEVDGQKIYDFKLSNDITVGTPGKDGKDGTPGSITIVGEKGKDGADGTPGKNATAEITVKEGTPGVDGKDGESITSIVYETGKDANGNPIVREVATLDDGMKFAGDDNTKYVAKKLNEQLDIKGGAAADGLTDNNIGVVADVDPKTSEITGLRVKLGKDINLPDGSVRIDGTTDEKGNPTGGIYIAKQNPTPKVAGKDAPDKAEEGLYITGLSNIDWNPGTNGIVENRAATEKQLLAVADSSARVDASNLSVENIASWKGKLGIDDTVLGEAGAWKLQVNDAGERSIKKNSIINFKDGAEIKVTQSGNDITIGVDPAFVKKVTDNTANISNLTTRVTKVEGDITTIGGKVTNLETKVNTITNNGIVTKVEGDEATGVKVTPVDANDATKGVQVSLDEKITVGGIVIDGTKAEDGASASHTITGLTNTTWDGETYESGRAATEDQLHAVDGKITNIIDNISSIAGGTTIKEGDGNIKAVKTEDKNEYTLSLNKDLKVENSISVAGNEYITKDGINANNQVITNVGEAKLEAGSNNAATVNQVVEVRDQLTEQLGGVANVVQNNTRQISRLDSKINKAGAGAAALAALHPLDFDPDNKWNFTAGVGTYHGASSVAIGAFYRPNEETMFSIGGAVGNSEDMMNIGVSLKFGESNPYAGMSRGRLIEYVEQQTNEIDALKAQNESQNERIQKLEELVQSLIVS